MRKLTSFVLNHSFAVDQKRLEIIRSRNTIPYNKGERSKAQNPNHEPRNLMISGPGKFSFATMADKLLARKMPRTGRVEVPSTMAISAPLPH
jgi:hypothetical protein